MELLEWALVTFVFAGGIIWLIDVVLFYAVYRLLRLDKKFKYRKACSVFAIATILTGLIQGLGQANPFWKIPLEITKGWWNVRLVHGGMDFMIFGVWRKWLEISVPINSLLLVNILLNLATIFYFWWATKNIFKLNGKLQILTWFTMNLLMCGWVFVR